MAIVLDAKTLCECGSQAKYRMPPARAPQINKLLEAVLAARGGSLNPGDCLVAPDGFKGADWEEKIMKAVPGLRVAKQFAVYTQESVEGRMDRTSSSDAPLDLVETVNFCTTEPLNLKFQARKLVPKQSTRANFIGPLALPAYSEVDTLWNIRVSEKKGLYGPSNLPLPGGACPIQHAKDPRPKSWDIVPAFYHEGPPILATELAHVIGAKAVIDLTPGSGHWAMYAIRQRIPYIGVVFTDLHAEMLHQKLISGTLKAMADSNDDMYDAGMASLLKDTAGKQEGGDGGANTGPGNQNQGAPGGADPQTQMGTKYFHKTGGNTDRDKLLARIESIRQMQQGSKTDAGVATGAGGAPPAEEEEEEFE